MSSRQHDYIPRPLAQFNEWYANLINYIKQVTFTQENPWTHIPAQEGNAFVAAFDAWTAAYTPTLGPHIIWDKGIFCVTPCSIFTKTPLQARLSGGSEILSTVIP